MNTKDHLLDHHSERCKVIQHNNTQGFVVRFTSFLAQTKKPFLSWIGSRCNIVNYSMDLRNNEQMIEHMN
jgi:hypothetical protein